MSTSLPQAADPLALLRPRGKAAAGRAGAPATTAAAAAQQRAAHAAAGGAAAAATHPAGAARGPSFAQMLGRAGVGRPAAGAGPIDSLHPDSTQHPLGTGEDAALARTDAPQDPAALLAATAPPLPAPAATPLPLAAATQAGAPPGLAATDAAAQPGADGLASETDARQAPPPLVQTRQPLPHGAAHRSAQPLAQEQNPARDPAATTATGRPEALPAEPAVEDAGSGAPTSGMPLMAPPDVESSGAADARPVPTPDHGALPGRAWKAIDQAPPARTAPPADQGRLQPAGPAAAQSVERAALASGTTPAAPAVAAAQATAAGAGRTGRAAGAAEGKVETPIAASASIAGPGSNSASTAPPRPALPSAEATPLPPSVARSVSPLPASPAPDAVAAAGPSRTAEAAPEQPLPPAAWFVPPAPAAAAAAAASSALATEAQASLAAHPQSPAFAPELGAQLTHFARNGVEHARLALNPADMGPVTVQIQLEGSNAQVHLSAEHALTRQALEQAMPQLAGSLREAGLTLSGGGVFEQPRQGRDTPDGQPGRTPLPQRGSAGDDAAGSGLGAAPELRRRGVVDLVA